MGDTYYAGVHAQDLHDTAAMQNVLQRPERNQPPLRSVSMSVGTQNGTARSRRIGAAAMPPKRINLNECVSNKSDQLPPRVIINGVGGIGKTSLAAKFPKPIFLLSSGETGLITLQDNGLIDPSIPHFSFPDGNGGTLNHCSIWEEAISAIDSLTTQEHEYRTLVFDVLNGFEKLCHEYICETKFGGNWDAKTGFDSYQAGPRVALPEWMQFIQLLNGLREKRKMYIVGLCHTQTKNFKNPMGPDYDRYKPDMNDKTWDYTFGQFDVVLFCHRYVIASKEKGESKAKGKGGEERLIEVESSAAFDAKNRHGMKDPIPMGDTADEAWVNLTAAMSAAKQANKSK